MLGKTITGPELASLLEILVAAANEGSLAEVCSNHIVADHVVYNYGGPKSLECISGANAFKLSGRLH